MRWRRRTADESVPEAGADEPPGEGPVRGDDLPRAWWADEPVLRAADDSLGRAPFASRAAELIDAVGSRPSSTVVALVGAWGSGKTSTVNLMVDALDPARWGIARINPWALSGPDAVVTDLLAGIRAKLPPNGPARAALDKYGTFAVPLLAGVPVVGGTASVLAGAALDRMRAGSAQDRIDEAARALERLGRPVLVVVDDVDRLLPAELLALFKAVRVLGRLPHVHYLLAYDEQTVLDVLGATDIAAGSQERALAFVEKIVTLRLDQPPVRPAQAEEMLRKGVEEALADSGMSLSEDQAQRLADEQEALLGRSLTEPRSVARFLAQLRAYLPLLGPREVDTVDFLVLTLLRTTQPRLYRALAADQLVLSGAAEGPAQEDALAAWQGDHRLVELEVPLDDVPRVLGALRRLFPLLQGEQTVLHAFDRAARRRERRASDPDHVSRYFALVQEPGELSDAAVAAALDEWASGRPGPHADAARRAMLPGSHGRTELTAAARALRRAASHSERVGPDRAAALLPAAVGVLADVARRDAPPSAQLEAAAIAWTASLVVQAPDLHPAPLLSLVAAPLSRRSALVPLLRAIELARGDTRMGGVATGRSDPLAGMVAAAAEAAWTRFADHAAAGDGAGPEQTASLLRWLDDHLGLTETNRRLAGLLREGANPADVAARMVHTASSTDGSIVTLAGLDGPTALRRIGRGAVAAAEEGLVAIAGPATARHDEDDLTWRNRRSIAARGLLEALAAADDARLPVLASVGRDSLVNHQPDVLGAPNGEEPDLRVQATFVLPADAALSAPPSSEVPRAHELEETARTLLAGGPLARWLSRVAPLWQLSAAPWQIIASSGHAVTVASAARARDERSGWRVQTPILVGGQLRALSGSVGTDSRGHGLVLTVAAGLWLAELGPDRLPSATRHSGSPMPAALTVAEAYDLLGATTASAASVLAASGALRPDGPRHETLLLDVKVAAAGGPGSVLDLSGVKRVPGGNMGYAAAYHLAAKDVGGSANHLVPGPDSVAAVTLNEWLLAAGYRGHESRVDDAWRARPE